MVMSTPTQLQTSYYTNLNGAITYDSNTVQVYSTVPVSPSYPYIQLGAYTEQDMSTKDTFGDEVTFSLTIVDRFQGNFGSEASIYSVYDDVKNIIRARPLNLSLSGYNLYTSVVDNVITREERSDTYTYKILEVRFRHKIEKQ